MIELLKQELLAKENILLILESEVKKGKVMCDAICDTSDFIQKLDSSCDTIKLVDANNDDIHLSLSCYENHNDDYISKGELYIDDDKISCFEKNTKGIGLKLMKHI